MFFSEQGIHGYESFFIAAIIFAMTPGLDTIFVLNKAFSKGRRAAVVGALGVNAGVLVHTIAAAFGLSIILSQSTTAFLTIKWAGAAYLCWLGVRSILYSRGHQPRETLEATGSVVIDSLRELLNLE